MSDVVQADKLKSFIERLERSIEEKKEILDHIKSIKSEAKCEGYDVKIIDMIVKLRAMASHDREEQALLLETYRSAVGL